MFYKVFLFLALRFDPESIHERTIGVLTFLYNSGLFSFLKRFWTFSRPSLTIATPPLKGASSLPTPSLHRWQKWGWSSPIGLAAGLDKEGRLLSLWADMGFSFAEVGTVTPLPQPGNPRPRIFRYPEQKALINRMGFPSSGAQELHHRLLKQKPFPLSVGINLGKNKNTPAAAALDDYVLLLEQFRDIAQFFVINISSPNTPGLRDLQSETFLSSIGKALGLMKLRQPVFLKLAPEIESPQIKALFEAAQGQIQGLILTNTLATSEGGLSGIPLQEISRRRVGEARRAVGPNPFLISVGGIDSVDEARRRFDAGADAIEIYTSLIYKGPALVHELRRTYGLS